MKNIILFIVIFLAITWFAVVLKTNSVKIGRDYNFQIIELHPNDSAVIFYTDSFKYDNSNCIHFEIKDVDTNSYLKYYEKESLNFLDSGYYCDGYEIVNLR